MKKCLMMISLIILISSCATSSDRVCIERKCRYLPVPGDRLGIPIADCRCVVFKD